MSDGTAQSSKSPVIVIGVDGTEPSLVALRQTAIVACAIKAEVAALYVRHLPALASDPNTGQAIALMGETLDELEANSKSAVEQTFSGTGLTVRFETRSGDPGHEMIELAHELGAACVVVGATIHGAVSSVLLSSVAEYLVHHSDVSVVIVRP